MQKTEIEYNQRNREIVEFAKSKGMNGFYASLIGELCVASEYHVERTYQKEAFKLRSIFDRLPKRITELLNQKDGTEW